MTAEICIRLDVVEVPHQWEQCPVEKDHVSWSERCQFQKGHGNEPHSWDSQPIKWREKEREEARKEASEAKAELARIRGAIYELEAMV